MVNDSKIQREERNAKKIETNEKKKRNYVVEDRIL